MKKIILISCVFLAILQANPFERSSGNIFNKNADPIREEMLSKEVKEQMRQNDLKFKKLKECDRYKDEFKYKKCITGVQATPNKKQKELKNMGKINKKDEDFAMGFFGNLPKPEVNINKIERLQGKNKLTERQVKKIEEDGKKAMIK